MRDRDVLVRDGPVRVPREEVVHAGKDAVQDVAPPLSVLVVYAEPAPPVLTWIATFGTVRPTRSRT